jgi:CHAT domain-containing protein
MSGRRRTIRGIGLFLLVLAVVSVREGSPRPAACVLGRGRALPRLDARTAVVEFRLGERESFALIFTGKKAWTVVLPSRNRVERSVNGFIRAVGRAPGNMGPIRRAARRIAAEILPFEPNLAGLGVSRLILIPDGILKGLAFEALRTGQGTRKAWLIEKYAVSYSSRAFLSEESPRKPETLGTRLLALGATAPCSGRTGIGFDGNGGVLHSVRREIKAVSRLFPGKSRCVYMDREANLENFRKHRGEKFLVIHIAAHGRRAVRSAASTRLVLSPGGNGRGELRVADVRGCGISAGLVVLSACETAAGPRYPGAGGLPQAFLREGARSVVATIWPVPDRTTSEFMAHFYRSLKSGLDRSGALQSAKRGMIRRGRSHPFYWAGYVLFGRPDGPIAF